MNDNEKNVRTLSKQEVIELSNTEKRLKFIDSYKEWGVWLEIPSLKVRIYKIAFPTDEVLYATEYPSHSYFMKECPVVAFRFVKPTSVYGQYADVRSDVANRLKELKMKYCEEMKKGEK